MVIESYVYIVDKNLERFESEVNDLQKIALFQAGQISRSQLTLNPVELSMMSKIYNLEEPLTLLKLKQVLEDHVFRKVKLIHQVMRIGIMDYCIIEEDYNYKDQYSQSDSELSNNSNQKEDKETTQII